jgi:hypothetical protein
MPARAVNEQQFDREIDRGGPDKAEKIKGAVKSPQFKKAVDELADNPRAHDEAKRDPEGFLRKHGVPIPPGARAEFVPDNWRIGVCANGFCCGYDFSTGWGCW